MRIVFIIPPSGFQLDERVYPMLGILKVASSLDSIAKMDSDVARMIAPDIHALDLSGTSNLVGDTHTAVRSLQADVYAITATMPQMPAALQITDVIRAISPRARVILGGAHPTMVNAAAKRGVSRSQLMLGELLQRFDCTVAGDGELAIFSALNPDVDKLVDADDPASMLFLKPHQVASSPWPDRSLIDLQSYHCWVDGVPATSMIAQLGCPFGCGFCGGRFSPTYRRVRTRPVEDVVDEMTEIYEVYGYKGFMFLDDELNVSRTFVDFLKLVLERQKSLNTDWHLCGLLKSELFTEEQAHLMYEAGFRKVLIGFESGDDRILLNMNKRATKADNTRAVALAHAAGLRVKALMSLGHPGESPESILRTREWLLSVRPDEFDATVLTLYPGTPYHDEAKETAPGVWTYTAKNGDRLHAYEVDQFTDTPYYKGIPGQYSSFVWTDALSREDLVAMRDQVEADVRSMLNIAWPKTAVELNYEHSMGLS